MKLSISAPLLLAALTLASCSSEKFDVVTGHARIMRTGTSTPVETTPAPEARPLVSQKQPVVKQTPAVSAPTTMPIAAPLPPLEPKAPESPTASSETREEASPRSLVSQKQPAPAPTRPVISQQQPEPAPASPIISQQQPRSSGYSAPTRASAQPRTQPAKRVLMPGQNRGLKRAY